jgi:hypothetical protein
MRKAIGYYRIQSTVLAGVPEVFIQTIAHSIWIQYIGRIIFQVLGNSPT